VIPAAGDPDSLKFLTAAGAAAFVTVTGVFFAAAGVFCATMF